MSDSVSETQDDGNGWWNHRLIVEDTSDGPWYSIRECFYSANGKIWGCSAEPDGIVGESIEGLEQSLEWMREALSKPAIRLEDIPEEGSESPADFLDGEDLSSATTLEELEIMLEEKFGEDWDKEE